jgi:hypothetical protein
MTVTVATNRVNCTAHRSDANAQQQQHSEQSLLAVVAAFRQLALARAQFLSLDLVSRVSYFLFEDRLFVADGHNYTTVRYLCWLKLAFA